MHDHKFFEAYHVLMTAKGVKLIKYVALSLSIIINVAGQLLLKLGVNEYQLTHQSFNILQALLNTKVMFGFVFYALSAGFWLWALSKMNLSIAYPTLALGYVLAYFVAGFLLHEPIAIKGVLGVLLIMGGIVLLHV